MSNLWAIYNEEGRRILENSSFISYTYNTRARVMESPLEKGSFAQYNKVSSSASLSLSLAYNGSIEELELTIQILEEEKSKLSKLSIISPEKNFRNYTLHSFSYSKSALSGVNIFDLDFQEIRELEMYSTNIALSQENIVNPSDASVLERGRVQLEEVSSIIKSFF